MQHVMSNITITTLVVYATSSYMAGALFFFTAALDHRRNVCRLSLLYKITHHLVAIDQNLYLVHQTHHLT